MCGISCDARDLSAQLQAHVLWASHRSLCLQQHHCSLWCHHTSCFVPVQVPALLDASNNVLQQNKVLQRKRNQMQHDPFEELNGEWRRQACGAHTTNLPLPQLLHTRSRTHTCTALLYLHTGSCYLPQQTRAYLTATLCPPRPAGAVHKAFETGDLDDMTLDALTNGSLGHGLGSGQGPPRSRMALRELILEQYEATGLTRKLNALDLQVCSAPGRCVGQLCPAVVHGCRASLTWHARGSAALATAALLAVPRS